MQKNWIGKSEGAEIDFNLINSELKNNKIKIFTTRPDTIFGATFIAISCQHPFVDELIKTNGKIKKFITKKLKSNSLKRSNVVIVIGGDGFMLQTLKKNKINSNLFYGINSGNYGFLMNKFSRENIILAKIYKCT